MAASQLFMIVGYIFMAIGMSGSLYLGSVVVGVCYGVRLSISVPTASELFGLKYYGMIYNFLILNLPIGSFLFSGLLAGILYDIEAAKSHKNGEAKSHKNGEAVFFGREVESQARGFSRLYSSEPTSLLADCIKTRLGNY